MSSPYKPEIRPSDEAPVAIGAIRRVPQHSQLIGQRREVPDHHEDDAQLSAAAEEAGEGGQSMTPAQQHIDQIRADAAEEARRAAGEWFRERFTQWLNCCETPESFEARVQKEFGL